MQFWFFFSILCALLSRRYLEEYSDNFIYKDFIIFWLYVFLVQAVRPKPFVRSFFFLNLYIDRMGIIDVQHCCFNWLSKLSKVLNFKGLMMTECIFVSLIDQVIFKLHLMILWILKVGNVVVIQKYKNMEF